MISIPSILQALWIIVSFGGNPVTLNTQESQYFHMRPAWNATGQVIRFVPFAASDVMVAKLLDYDQHEADDFAYVPVDWAPALTCAFDRDVLNDVYLINCGQTVIFSVEPPCELYTPLWRVHYLEFSKGNPIRPIHTLEEVLEAIETGELMQIREDSVLDATIVQNSNRDVIPQALDFDLPTRSIELPLIEVFYKIRFQPRSYTGFISATDTSDLDLATRIGANYAPRLVNMSPDCCDPIYAFVNPASPGQLPIVRNVQEYRPFDQLQVNQSYNPIRCWNLFSLPQSDSADFSQLTVKSQQITDFYVSRGIIEPIPLDPAIVTNSPFVLPTIVWSE